MLSGSTSNNQVLQTIKSEVHLRKEKSRQREHLLRQLATEVGNEPQSLDISESVADILKR